MAVLAHFQNLLLTFLLGFLFFATHVKPYPDLSVADIEIFVVVSSGERLVIAHLPQESGNKKNFEDDIAFLDNIHIPLDETLRDNARWLGAAPHVMVFGPTVVPNGAFSNAGKMNELAGVIRGVFPAVQEADIAKYAYLKQTELNEDDENVYGKVTVNWVPPVNGQGTAELLVWAETTLKIHAFYYCQDRRCLWAITM
ncbi:hypothetical protein K432DRAFT_399143 [Lepidopterella palustris CBS 459.81]|uniref:Uncharacterized protein n=1 Tax=Lepidopterella palustris CBS 459.81 TaxID=1314670 RepID=A0A8E2DWI1_9PEZI|nr:hypothetical protein K432DRAFT_399143 [Lepidopterella palustris CBS 459.81]